jgi:hypothetical protein
MVKLLICGGGNGAHVLAGLASSVPDVEARVLTLFADEAERWTKAMAEGGFAIKIHEHGKLVRTLTSKPALVTKDTAKAAEGVDVIIITVPAFAHAGYLEALKDHVREGVVLAGLPGQAGFEFAVRGTMGPVAQKLTVVSFETLPWACRITKFGQEAEVLGFKEKILGSVSPGAKTDPREILQKVMTPKPVLFLQGHIIGMTFMGVNAYIHPCIMYGEWKNWDGKPLEKKPLFYHGVSQESAQLLHDVSREICELAKSICARHKDIDLSQVEHVHDWYKRCYPDDIEDKSSLYSCLRTNKAYNGLCHPVTTDAQGRFSADFKYRYLTEDIPFGLVVIKGIAEIAGMSTPAINQVLEWAQGRMGKEYIKGGKLVGPDAMHSRSPQAFGINNEKTMLGLE